jgi:hypothetical protein
LSDINVHSAVQSSHFLIHVLAGIDGDCFVGPFVLPHMFTGVA